MKEVEEERNKTSCEFAESLEAFAQFKVMSARRRGERVVGTRELWGQESGGDKESRGDKERCGDKERAEVWGSGTCGGAVCKPHPLTLHRRVCVCVCL